MKIGIKQIGFSSVTLVIMLVCVYSSVFGMAGKKIFPEPANIEISMRTGSMIITRPDNKIFNVDLEDEIPWIPSGSMIEIVWGRAQLNIGVIEVIIKKGGRIKLWENRKTGTVNVVIPKKSKTNIKITVGEMFIIADKGDKIKIMIDEIAKIAKITVIKGTVAIVRRGKKKVIARQGTVTKSLLSSESRLANLSQPEPEVIEELESSPHLP